MSQYSYQNSKRSASNYGMANNDLQVDGQSMMSRPQSSLNYGFGGSKKSTGARIQSAGYSALKSRQTGSIPVSDLMRIREKIGLEENLTNENKAKEKLDLYQKSQNRVQHWPNTLKANIKQKDDQRFQRFKKDEEERRKIDEQERIYQAGVKREILDKSNKQLYERDDRVKEFKSKIDLVETLDHRNQQIEMKKYVKEIQDKREQIYVYQMEDRIRVEDEKEAIRQDILKKKRAQTAKILRQQHEEQKQRYIGQLQTQKIEGEIIKIRAQELLEKEKDEEKLRYEKAKQLQKDIKQGNEELEVLRTNLKEKEKLEDAMIEKYAKKKERMQEMRKKREKFIFDEKQAQRQKLIDDQTKRLNQIYEKENARLNKDIKEAEIKAEQIEKIKKEKRKELVKKIDTSIKQNIERKRVQSALDKQEDQNFKNYWIDKNQKIQEREKNDKIEFQKRCKELQEFHLLQAAEKQKQREKVIYQELEEEDKIRQIQENDKTNFSSWAQRMIVAQKDEGRDVVPLLTLLGKLNQ